MKEITSTIKFNIADQAEFIRLIQQEVSEYDVKYKKFSRIYELKNKDFKHSIWYNQNEGSEIKSKRVKAPKELIIANLGLLLLLPISFYLNRKFGWFDDHMIFFYIYLFLTIPVNWIVNNMKPEYQKELQESHEQIVNYLRML